MSTQALKERQRFYITLKCKLKQIKPTREQGQCCNAKRRLQKRRLKFLKEAWIAWRLKV
jgi:hypothetical protein